MVGVFANLEKTATDGDDGAVESQAERLAMSGPIRTIPVAVDFSEPSRRALDYAVAVARHAGATLHILHAWRLPFWFPPAGSPPAEMTPSIENALDSWRESANRELDALRERAEGEGVACRTHLEIGAASAVIAQAVETHEADLVVVGSQGRSALEHVLLGSAAERVMRIAACPVVVVPESTEVAPRLPLRKVVVGVDFSPSSRRALDLAVRLGEVLGRPEILLIYAHHVPLEIETMVGEEAARALDAVENRPQARLEEWRRRLVDKGW